jgi:hypothetical protein
MVRGQNFFRDRVRFHRTSPEGLPRFLEESLDLDVVWPDVGAPSVY